MRALLFSLSLVLALPAAAAPKCDVTRFPFPMPAAQLSEGWTDTEWAQWGESAVAAYCAGRESSAACRCARKVLAAASY